MTEPTPAAQQPPALSIIGQYVKDLSFEAPSVPGIFGLLQKDAPDVAINIDVRARPLQDKTFEVVLHVKAECKVGGNVAFIAEMAYAGMFGVNVPEQHLQPMLLVEAPRYLFPFARALMSDVTREGGFPPLMLTPVDFLGMYQQSQQGKAAAPTATA